MAIAKKKQLSNMLFLPMQTKKEMPDIWSLCDVALVHLKNHPAFAEVIPSKIFEAMGMGLPILLVTPRGDAQEIVDRHTAGVWVPPENTEALAKKITALSSNRKLIDKLGANALIAAPKYSRVIQANKMITVFNEALRENSEK
jgi:glycosyltransferase involved in cell wall biosynthesis